MLKQRTHTRKQLVMAQFVEEGYQLSEEIGYENLTVRALTSRLNYNSSMVYYYFSNFDNLLKLIAIHYLTPFEEELCRIQMRYAFDSTAMLLHSLDAFVASAVDYPRQFQVLYRGGSSWTLEEALEVYHSIFSDAEVCQTYPVMTTQAGPEIPLLDMCILQGRFKIKSRDKLTELIGCISDSLIEKAVLARNEEKPMLRTRFCEYMRLFFEHYSAPPDRQTICIAQKRTASGL